jgi:hypothetical protein
MKCLRVLFLSLLLWQSAGTAEAGIIASFTADGSAFMPSAINVGQFVDVSLYLRYENTSTDPDNTDSNYLNSPGLFSAGLGVTFNPGVTNVTSGSFGPGWNLNSPFSLVVYDNILGTAGIVTGIDLFDPYYIAVTGPSSILVGTLTFTGISAGTMILTLGDYNNLTADTAVDDFPTTILDGIIEFGRTASITVNASPAAVPEPTTGILFLLGAGVLALRRRRHKNSHV